MTDQLKNAFDGIFKVTLDDMKDSQRRSVKAIKLREKRVKNGDPFVKDLLIKKEKTK